MEDDKKIKENIIEHYEDLLKSAIEKEEYENAAKYKKYIDNLKKSGEKN